MRALILIAAAGVSACSSIDLPELNMLDRAFRDTETDLNDTPSVSDAPTVPTDMRPTGEWEEAAKAIMAERGSFDIPEGEPTLSSEALRANFEELREEVRAYELDDPASGPAE